MSNPHIITHWEFASWLSPSGREFENQLMLNSYYPPHNIMVVRQYIVRCISYKLPLFAAHRTGEGDSQISTNVADDFDASDNEVLFCYVIVILVVQIESTTDSDDYCTCNADAKWHVGTRYQETCRISGKKRSGKKKDSGSKQSSKGIINSPDQGRGVKSSEGSLQRPQKRVTENMDSRTSSKPALGVDNGRDDGNLFLFYFY